MIIPFINIYIRFSYPVNFGSTAECPGKLKGQCHFIISFINICICISYPVNFGIYCGMPRQVEGTVSLINFCICISYPVNFGIYCGMYRQVKGPVSLDNFFHQRLYLHLLPCQLLASTPECRGKLKGQCHLIISFINVCICNSASSILSISASTAECPGKLKGQCHLIISFINVCIYIFYPVNFWHLLRNVEVS